HDDALGGQSRVASQLPADALRELLVVRHACSIGVRADNASGRRFAWALGELAAAAMPLGEHAYAAGGQVGGAAAMQGRGGLVYLNVVQLQAVVRLGGRGLVSPEGGEETLRGASA